MPGFKMGYGYGSECHLLRYLGWHRKLLDALILKSINKIGTLSWFDFEFDCDDTSIAMVCRSEENSGGETTTYYRRAWQDKELTGITFIDPQCQGLKDDWASFRPSRGNTINWDAVAKLETAEGSEILLIEAKAHAGELVSSIEAGSVSRGQIGSYMDRVKASLGVSPHADWLQGYYQYANHITALWILNNHGYRARLVQIFFTGDQSPGNTCPQNESDWLPYLDQREQHMGLTPGHSLNDRIHRIFVPVCM